MRKTAAPRNAPDLHCHSTFSLLDGFGSPESVVKRAVELGWGAAALTEHGWMGSVPLFYEACRAHKIKPIVGCELYVVPDEELGLQDKEHRSASNHLTVLALSVEGYMNMVKWQNVSMLKENFYYTPRISVERMIEHATYPLHHNVVLSGCMGGELCQTIAAMNGSAVTAGVAYIEAMKTVFPNFYVELQNHKSDKFMGRGFERYEEMVESQAFVRQILLRIAELTNTPTVLTNDSHYQRADQRKAHIAMIASKMNRWAKEDAQGQRSDPVKDYGYWTNHMRSMEKLEAKTDGAEGCCENVLALVAESNLRLDPLDKFSYAIPDSGQDDPIAEIVRRSRSRLKGLVRKHGDVAATRFEHELAAMGEFAHYLIMMSDLIVHARKSGILTNTRGSAANSIVCYCLKIHEIDSIEYKLTFERFVNPERKKLPDIDIDIQYDRYDDFMEYVHEYVAEREGTDNLALLCNYGTLANRSTFRMVADSLGIAKEAQDEIANLLPQMIDSGLVDEEEDVYAALKETYPEIYELASDVFDNLKSVGQHACGWIFGTRERPLSDWVPNYWIASSGRTVTQFDYKTALKLGFNKGDFLRLKMLKVVSGTMRDIGMNPLDFHKLPLDDEATLQRIREGRTEGVFTLQGKTNRQGGMEVEPQDEHGVIAAVAIYRPSLTRPGYHRVYNARRRGEEEVEYPSRAAEEILGESFGLPIFQEQILDLGYRVGLDHVGVQELLDAIKLAKGVGRGAREAFDEIRPRFIATAVEGGLTNKEAEATWDLVGSFEGYGFNRGHATSYGNFAVRAAYLLEHNTQAYEKNLLDTYPEKHKYITAARSEGLKILPPDINTSTGGFNYGPDKKSIRVGLSRIDAVGPAAVKAIVAGQPFSSVDDLKQRTPGTAVKVTTVNNLAAAGAFSSFGINATDDDTELFGLLGFLLDKPKAMVGLPKPKHTKARGGSWTHLGLVRDVELTEYRTSVSKLFWIPELEPDKLLKKKASTWARVKTWLLLAVDENGVPFHLMVNEDKGAEAEYLHFIVKKHRGSVLCLDGAIRKPFDQDGPMGFRFFDVTGCYQGEPQVWNESIEDERMIKAFTVLHKKKRQAKG
jgi:DNA polymerase-3 subunit alpha